MRTHFVVGLFLASSLSFAGTSGCADEIDEAIDCNQICSRYQSCFDSSYNVGACRDRCEDNADADADFARKTDLCENCLDDRSCTESFACAAECSGIVP